MEALSFFRHVSRSLEAGYLFLLRRGSWSPRYLVLSLSLKSDVTVSEIPVLVTECAFWGLHFTLLPRKRACPYALHWSGWRIVRVLGVPNLMVEIVVSFSLMTLSTYFLICGTVYGPGSRCGCRSSTHVNCCTAS